VPLFKKKEVILTPYAIKMHLESIKLQFLNLFSVLVKNGRSTPLNSKAVENTGDGVC
jgi:hypothetical protein